MMQFFISLFFRCFDFCAGFGVKIKYRYDVLLIRLDAIGDFIIWSDTVRAYRELYSNQKIALLCQQSVKEIAEKFEGIALVIPLERHIQKRLLYRWRLVRDLQRYHFKTAISSCYVRAAQGAEKCIRWINADQIIGYDGDPFYLNAKEKAKYNRPYTKLIETSHEWKNEFLRNEEFVQKLGLPAFKAKLPNLNFVQKNNLINDKYGVFFLGAGDLRRAWPVEKFAQLYKEIPPDIAIVLSGNAKESHLNEQLIELLKDHKNKLFNLTGKLSLYESLEIVKGAQFVVGNESSGIHIAAGLGVQSVCIAGGGHWQRFTPYPDTLPNKKLHPQIASNVMECYRCNWNCRYPLVNRKWKCVAEIDVSQVSQILSTFVTSKKGTI